MRAQLLTAEASLAERPSFYYSSLFVDSSCRIACVSQVWPFWIPPLLGLIRPIPCNPVCEISPRVVLYPVFQILRVRSQQIAGIALQTMVPLGLMLIPFI